MATFSVSSSGPGWFSRYITTIAEALTRAAPGDTISIDKGEYKEDLIINKAVHICGASSTDTIIVGNITIKASGVSLRTFKICNPSGIAISILGPGVDPTIASLHIDDFKDAGICCEHRSGGTISDCEISSRSQDSPGLVITEGASPAIKNCKIHNLQSFGIWITKGASPLIDGGEIFNCGGAGVYVSDPGSKPTIRGTQIFDMPEYGIRLKGGSQASIMSCRVSKCANVALVISGRDTSPTIFGARIYDTSSPGIRFEEEASGSLRDVDVSGCGTEQSSVGISIINASPQLNSCKIHDCAGIGIIMHDRAKPTISRCEIETCFLGLVMGGAETRPTVRDVKIERTTGRALHFSESASGEFTAVKITECGIEGQPSVVIEGSSKPTLESCVVSNASGLALAVLSGARPLILRGEIDRCTVGIEVRDADTHPVLSGLKIRNAQSYGLIFGLDAGGDVQAVVLSECGAENLASLLIDCASPSISMCKIHDSFGLGIIVRNRGCPKIDDCEIWNCQAAVMVDGTDTTPEISGLRVRQIARHGVIVTNRAAGRISQTDISECGESCGGLSIQGGATPTISGCLIHDSQGYGVIVKGAARPIIEDCEIRNCRYGIDVEDHGSSPEILKTSIIGSRSTALSFETEAMGLVGECELTGGHDEENVMLFVGSGAKPTVRSCTMRGGGPVAVLIAESAPQFEGGLVSDSKGAGIVVMKAGTEPIIKGLRIQDVEGNGISFTEGAAGSLEEVEIGKCGDGKGAVFIAEGASPRISRCRINHAPAFEGSGKAVTE